MDHLSYNLKQTTLQVNFKYGKSQFLFTHSKLVDRCFRINLYHPKLTSFQLSAILDNTHQKFHLLQTKISPLYLTNMKTLDVTRTYLS